MLIAKFDTGCKMDKICGALRDSVPFVQFKKHEKHPWWSVNFSKVMGVFHVL